MGALGSTDPTPITAEAESGQLCTLTVQRDPRGQHLLYYEGSESAAAILTPEIAELLTAVLSRRDRSVVMTRMPGGGACTLLVIGHQPARATLYFHASTVTSAVLDAAGIEKLRAALGSLGA